MSIVPEAKAKKAAYTRLANHRRRARLAGATVGTDQVAVADFERSMRAAARVRCYYCNRLVPKGKRTLDHIVPLARGGAHDVTNLCVACHHCNVTKSAKLPDEFNGQHVLPFVPFRNRPAR